MERQIIRTDERRSWHYPDPWGGVVWFPPRTSLRDRLRRVREIAAFAFRAASTAMIAGAVLTVVVGVAAGGH